MSERILQTPLFAAFFCLTILAGCTTGQPHPEVAISQCPSPTTSIAGVQGSVATSPMLGKRVTVRGVVTLIQSGNGLFIEEPGSDTNKDTSNAIFILTTALGKGVEPGTLISVRGDVSEIGKGRYPLTALTGVDELIRCSDSQTLPLTEVALPLNGFDREALEGMRIQIKEPLTVTDVYQFGRGKFTLSGTGFQFVPTEVMPPGPDTGDYIRKNRAHALPVAFTDNMQNPGLLVSGTSIDHISGVMAHDGRGLRVSLQSITSNPATRFAPPDTPAADTLRIVAMNLHNYFNGDGKGAGFPTPRGAESANDFQQQRNRIGAAIGVLDPHVVAVMELENDGFGANSAAQDLIDLANNATRNTWAVTRPEGDNTGSDAITVGLFYRPDRLKPIGAAQTLSGPEFLKSRQPQAQVFKQLPGNEKIMIVINHLKSKGSCPDEGDNADQHDGQGCWNPMRLASAEKMSAWVKNLAAAAGIDKILILGDMNAYRNEDPVGAIRKAGFTELMDEKQGQTYSFVYFGQRGTLDYAFSSDALLQSVQQAFIWHVNAALPVNMTLPQPWLGFSDHDPVVVDIRARQASTSD